MSFLFSCNRCWKDWEKLHISRFFILPISATGSMAQGKYIPVNSYHQPYRVPVGVGSIYNTVVVVGYDSICWCYRITNISTLQLLCFANMETTIKNKLQPFEGQGTWKCGCGKLWTRKSHNYGIKLLLIHNPVLLRIVISFCPFDSCGSCHSEGNIKLE